MMAGAAASVIVSASSGLEVRVVPSVHWPVIPSIAVAPTAVLSVS